jgi:hypothetical protein
MEQVLLIVCAVAILLYILWRVDLHREQKLKLLSEKYAKRRLSDEAVIKAQAEFEKRLETNIDLPDAIRWRNAFIYWHLMRNWFATLHTSSRYSGASDKIKSDWLEYMALMEERATLGFIFAETEDEERRKASGEELIEVRRKITVIEDAMAAAVGQEAVNQLEAARSAPHGTFDVQERSQWLLPDFVIFQPQSDHTWKS